MCKVCNGYTREIKTVSDEVIKVYITGEESVSLTIDDLAPRFPEFTDLFLYRAATANPEERYSLEATPALEHFEDDSNIQWPWAMGLAFYGPTSESVINQADEALRKVKR